MISTTDVKFDIRCESEYNRILTLSMTNPEGQGFIFIHIELIGPGLYSVINRPSQKNIDILLNRLVEETHAHRMGKVVLFPDECRSYIKLVHGITIRKE